MTFEQIDFVLSPSTRKMAKYGKSKDEYDVLVETAIEEVLNMASKEIGFSPTSIFDKQNIGRCRCCNHIVSDTENYCSNCGLRLVW